MFTQYFGLKFNPFSKEVKIEDLFQGDDWNELYSRFKYLEQVRGIGLLVGEPGTGKTTALRRYLTSLQPSLFHPIYFPLSTLTVREFLRELAFELGEVPSCRKGETIRQVQKAIQSYYYERKITPVIVLDELHMATTALLEELRLILNFKMDSENPFMLILAGQPPLRSKLALNIHTPLRQRISVKHTMKGLTKEEIPLYIDSRLKAAGNTDRLFTASAYGAIHSITNGWPRLVNTLATNCLLYACEQKESQISDEEVFHAQGEMQLA